MPVVGRRDYQPERAKFKKGCTTVSRRYFLARCERDGEAVDVMVAAQSRQAALFKLSAAGWAVLDMVMFK